jgi:hypothetical protein
VFSGMVHPCRTGVIRARPTDGLGERSRQTSAANDAAGS